jgi:hypothetical protein
MLGLFARTFHALESTSHCRCRTSIFTWVAGNTDDCSSFESHILKLNNVRTCALGVTGARCRRTGCTPLLRGADAYDC